MAWSKLSALPWALAIGLVDRRAYGDVVKEALALAAKLVTSSLPAQLAVVRAVNAAFELPPDGGRAATVTAVGRWCHWASRSPVRQRCLASASLPARLPGGCCRLGARTSRWLLVSLSAARLPSVNEHVIAGP